MRKVIIAAGVLIVLVLAALLIAPLFINANSFRGRIEAEAQQRLHRPVHLGQMHLRLLPPRVRVDNALLGEDPRFGTGVFATVQELSLSLKFWPLLRKQVELSGVELRRPSIELIRDSQGAWNFSSLGAGAPAEQAHPPVQPAPAAPAQQPQPQAAPAGKPPALALDKLRITDGQVAITDYQKHQPRAVYDHLDVVLKNFAPDKAFDLSLAAHLPGKGRQTVSLDGTAGPIDRGNLIAMPFEGKLKLNEVSIDGVQKFLNTQALSGVEGVISGEASARNRNGSLASAGSLRIQDGHVRGVNIGYPVTVDYDVNDDLTGDVIHIQKGNLHLGSTPLAVTGNVNTRSKPAQVDLKLNAQNVVLGEVARLAAAFGVAFNANTKVEGRASADITARGAVSQPVLNGTLTARDLAISGQDIPTPVKVQAIDLALTPQQIRSNNFNATAANTNLAVQFTLSNYSSPSPLIDGILRTNDAQIGDLLSMARSWKPSAVQGVTGGGTLTLDMHATGPLKNPSALNLAGTGQVRNANLKTAAMQQPLTVHNANLRFTQNSAQAQDLAVALAGTNATGAATIRNFAAPEVQFTLNADKVNVAEMQRALGRSVNPGEAPRRTAAFLLVPQAQAQTQAAPVQASPGLLTGMTGGGTVNVGTIQYDQFVITSTHANVVLDHGIVRFSPVTAQLYGGQQTGAINLDTRVLPSLVQVNSRLQNVDANNLLSALTSVKNTLYGRLAATTQISFQAVSSNEVARSLNGNVALDLTNGRIAKLDLLNQLAAIGKFAGVRQNSQVVTDFTRMSGHFNIVNGVATTKDLRAEIANGSLAGEGSANLATQQLNMSLTAVLSKGFSETVGGTGIGGIMQTAVANNRGELVIPVLVTGTFDHPQVEPDAQKVAQMKLQNLLPTSGNPGSMTSGILGSITKGNAGGQGTQQGGVAGIVNAITGQQQKQPPPGQQPVASPPQQPSAPNAQQPGDVLNQAVEGILGGKKKQQSPQQPPPK